MELNELTENRSNPIVLRKGNWDGRVQVASVEDRTMIDLYICARPDERTTDFSAQVESMYVNLRSELESQGFSMADIMMEKVFLSEIHLQHSEFLALREAFYREAGCPLEELPATTFVEQPPAFPHRLCELQAYLCKPKPGVLTTSKNIAGLQNGVSGKIFEIGGQRFVFLTNLSGNPSSHIVADKAEEAHSMFKKADKILTDLDFSFRDVYRTWIYIRDIDQHYGDLNLARRAFFQETGITQFPASTGIGGAVARSSHNFGMDLMAVQGVNESGMGSIHLPNFIEASAYGSFFSRAMRLDRQGYSQIFISGTASIDSKGHVAHQGDIEKQVNCMLNRVESLLKAQGAVPGDIVSAITYLKRPEYMEPFRHVFISRGFPESAPHTLCLADICRPEWLCETEAIAICTGVR